MRLVFKETLASIRKWTWHHFLVFALTFYVHITSRLCQSVFSNVKKNMVASLSSMNLSQPFYPTYIWQKKQLFESTADADVFFDKLILLFYISYGIGLFVSGAMGDRLDIRLILACGMCGSATATFLFGYLYDFAHLSTNFYYYCYFLICLNGLLQSSIWPALLAVLGNWLSKSSTNFLLGLWCACSPTGNILSLSISNYSIDYGYPKAFLISSILTISSAVVAGIVSDMIGTRSPVIITMVLLSVGSMITFSNIGKDYAANVACVVFTGFFIEGCDLTINTIIVADLGEHEQIKNSAKVFATVSGIIDGSGTIGYVACLYFLPILNGNIPWNRFIYLSILMAGCSFVCILPVACKDILCLIKKSKENKHFDKLHNVSNKNA